MSAAGLVPPLPERAPRLSVTYANGDVHALLAMPGVLAVIGFGARAPTGIDDPRFLHVPLEAPGGHAPCEVWRVGGEVRAGRDDGLAWAHDGALMLGAIEVDEAPHGGIAAAAEAAYARLLDATAGSGYPHLLRLWNYLDAITEGAGDDERYRQFSLGRARAKQGRLPHFPAATAIGRRDGRRVLQVYWLAARSPGQHLENPRQVSAWRYPRQYGPQAPTFARATLPADPGLPLLVSGTASVVGHASLHPGDLDAQLEETFQNLEALFAHAGGLRPALPARPGRGSVLKVYLRDAALAEEARARLAALLPDTPWLLLHADVCRRELMVEIDGFHGPG